MKIINYLLAILPTLVILFITIKKYGPVQLKFFGICLALGMLSTLPAFQLERIEFLFDSENLNKGWSLFINAFLLVGFGEELFKFIALLAFTFFFNKIKSIPTGILYAVIIGMGFALVENIFYAYLYPLSTMAVRLFTAVPAHGVFAIIIGYFMGMGWSKEKPNWLLILRGLLFASLLHGVYDWLVLQSYVDWLTGLAIPTLGLVFFYAYWLIQYAGNRQKKPIS